MRQIVFTGRNKVSVKDAEDPTPAAGEVLIAVEAAGVNFADILARKGLYPDAPSFPCVVGYEVAGRVVALGENVDASWKDADVVALTRFGGYTEKLTVPLTQLCRKPDRLTYAEAASIPVAYLTAWMLLVEQGGLRKEHTVLIQNAGSGVGLAAIDIVRHVGARAIGTASEHKHDFLTGERGLDHAVNYREDNWPDRVRELTDNRGVDLAIDPLGPSSWTRSFSLLRLGGRLGMYGASEIVADNYGWIMGLVRFMFRMPTFKPLALMDKCCGVYGTNLLRMFAEPERAHDWLLTIMQGVDEGWVRPHHDRTFTFEEAEAAHMYIEERRSIGKVILVPGAAASTS
ncbi:alcohol dehydrogenase zinc-binding domain protein [Syncephalis pseudoplumigaleata]|uniref:Alcohol dehydrogenase zinc-binding domain protein n=1 Tax=Syncephalis pseudoplumigaleata TaxID=1712513 RepID=A0A4P9Z6A6_9FUNG|nr:alcohol dehydrogenase zinc-binding domain protein [Syncephalis pseudoplumigaleata]|eukprot:RKP27371.1 alcohol dehydrogenase zinc-binding domain protein [Syncephalis pseudoplumigaleata]